jgi:hypothetical protein
MMMHLKEFGIERLWPNRGTFWCLTRGTDGNHETLRIAGVPPELELIVGIQTSLGIHLLEHHAQCDVTGSIEIGVGNV